VERGRHAELHGDDAEEHELVAEKDGPERHSGSSMRRNTTLRGERSERYQFDRSLRSPGR